MRKTKLPQGEKDNSQIVYDIFARLAIFDAVPEDEIMELSKSVRIKHVSCGEYIAFEGEEITYTFLVVSGRVLMQKLSPNGKELIVDIVPSGDIFPLSVAISLEESSLTAKAHTDSKLVLIPKDRLKAVFDQYPKTYQVISQKISIRLKESMEMALYLAHEKVEVRIAATLLGLRDRLNVKVEDKHFKLELTRKELADLTGTSPETASRIARSLEIKRVLDLAEPGTVVVNDCVELEKFLV